MDGPLAQALSQGRERFNARFAQARRMNRRLEPADFSKVLVDTGGSTGGSRGQG